MTAEAISPVQPKSAALLVIGDEVLRGDVVDGNTSWLARRLYSMGIRLHRVVVLPDNKTDIAKEITTLVRYFIFVPKLPFHAVIFKTRWSLESVAMLVRVWLYLYVTCLFQSQFLFKKKKSVRA